ncbi:hypothetical protein FOA52_015072 [Chlamydomonas sp. UWO 241]|nr:hypothetical protein FOA52_015072 [Chlamydomonas sp. UWO 241]
MPRGPPGAYSLDEIVDISFVLRRFIATDANMCEPGSEPHTVSVSVSLQVKSPVGALALGGSNANTGLASTQDSALPLPALLAVFTLQLKLTGLAASAWMSSLSSSGPSSDIAVLGHDVGALLALPVISGSNGVCDAATLAAMHDLALAAADALASLGGAVRSWSCCAGPRYCGVSRPKLPSCGWGGAPIGQLLALAMRLPPDFTPATVVRTLASVSPDGSCGSSEVQLEVRTDLQIRILGPMPLAPSGAPPSPVLTAALHGAAMNVAPMLLPPVGDPVPLSVRDEGFEVLGAAAGGDNPDDGTGAGGGSDRGGSGDAAAGAGGEGGAGGSGSSKDSSGGGVSLIALVLAATLSVIVLTGVVAGAVFFVRYRRRHAGRASVGVVYGGRSGGVGAPSANLSGHGRGTRSCDVRAATIGRTGAEWNTSNPVFSGEPGGGGSSGGHVFAVQKGAAAAAAVLGGVGSVTPTRAAASGICTTSSNTVLGHPLHSADSIGSSGGGSCLSGRASTSTLASVPSGSSGAHGTAMLLGVCGEGTRPPSESGARSSGGGGKTEERFDASDNLNGTLLPPPPLLATSAFTAPVAAMQQQQQQQQQNVLSAAVQAPPTASSHHSAGSPRTAAGSPPPTLGLATTPPMPVPPVAAPASLNKPAQAMSTAAHNTALLTPVASATAAALDGHSDAARGTGSGSAHGDCSGKGSTGGDGSTGGGVHSADMAPPVSLAVNVVGVLSGAAATGRAALPPPPQPMSPLYASITTLLWAGSAGRGGGIAEAAAAPTGAVQRQKQGGIGRAGRATAHAAAQSISRAHALLAEDGDARPGGGADTAHVACAAAAAAALAGRGSGGTLERACADLLARDAGGSSGAPQALAGSVASSARSSGTNAKAAFRSSQLQAQQQQQQQQQRRAGTGVHAP